MIKKSMYSSIFLFLLTNAAFAESMKPCVVTPGKVYAGVFGGGGSTNNFNISQYGTAFFTEAEGGALGVNAFGNSNNRSAWLYGAQVGYQAPAITLDCCSQWALVPAVELEGYYLNNTTFRSHLVNSEITRLDEHDFDVSYPLNRSVFLANAVFNLNIPCVKFHPYVGAGFGSAIVRISGADSTQIAPPQPGINHYNSKTNDNVTTFAAQVKLGLSYDITDCIGVFAEYRGLYLSSTHYIFGSTVHPVHAVTSSWQVKLDPQYTNIGTIGIRFSV